MLGHQTAETTQQCTPGVDSIVDQSLPTRAAGCASKRPDTPGPICAFVDGYQLWLQRVQMRGDEVSCPKTSFEVCPRERETSGSRQ